MDPPRAMSRSYEAFLQWVSVEALAELCAEAAQEMGFSETSPPNNRDQYQAIMRKAYAIHRERRWQRKAQRANDGHARRRARKADATIEHFTRQEIIDRDKSTCHLCGKHCDPIDIHLDHVIPLSRGGDHSRENVKVACSQCNMRKGARIPSSHPATVQAT